MVFFLFIMLIATIFFGISNTYVWIFKPERFEGVFERSKIVYYKIAKYSLVFDVAIVLTYLLHALYYSYFKLHT